MKQLSKEIKKLNQEKDFLLSQNAIRRVCIQETNNATKVLLDGNKKVHAECSRMNEENLKFQETHT